MKLHKNTLRLGIALALALSPLSATPDAWQKHIQEISEQVKINPDKAHPIAFAQPQSLHSHNGTSHSFSTSHILLRKIVKEELKSQRLKKSNNCLIESLDFCI